MATKNKAKAQEPATAGFWPEDAKGRYVTQKQVAAYLGVTERWVIDARTRGILRAHRLSHKTIRFDRLKVEAWAEAQLEDEFSWDK